jgi:hypothetical protein
MPKNDRDSLGRFLRPDGSPAPLPDPAAKKPRRRPPMFKHFKVDHVLADEDERTEYERLVADPKSTARQLQAWLRARGHRVCRSAVLRHRQASALDLRAVKECSQMAAAFCELTRRHGPNVVAEANHARFEMLLMQSLFKMKGAPTMPPEEWQRMSKLTSAAVATRRSVEEMREEYDRRAKQAADEAAAAAAKGATGKDVVARMREIMGV